MIENKQLIIYGAPGTGKSFMIDSFLKEKNIKKENIIRVVFHYEYSYSDFVGYITPQTKSNNSELTYSFIPGPFTLALTKAFNTNEEIFLVIEEINRGNTASIFGDIFQLLDRDSSNVSQYPINNITIRSYIDEKIGNNILENYRISENEIILPSNFNILCTMNTADQNVFTLDTAFKRRFKMKYLPIDFDTKTSQLNLLDSVSKLNIFDNKHTWTEFAQYINSIIDKFNYSTFSISEDKKLGQYFVEEKDVSSKQAFCDKVIYYLRNDVFKYIEGILDDSYEKIYDEIVKNEKDIFDLISKEKINEV